MSRSTPWYHSLFFTTVWRCVLPSLNGDWSRLRVYSERRVRETRFFYPADTMIAIDVLTSKVFDEMSVVTQERTIYRNRDLIHKPLVAKWYSTPVGNHKNTRTTARTHARLQKMRPGTNIEYHDFLRPYIRFMIYFKVGVEVARCAGVKLRSIQETASYMLGGNAAEQVSLGLAPSEEYQPYWTSPGYYGLRDRFGSSTRWTPRNRQSSRLFIFYM